MAVWPRLRRGPALASRWMYDHQRPYHAGAFGNRSQRVHGPDTSFQAPPNAVQADDIVLKAPNKAIDVAGGAYHRRHGFTRFHGGGPGYLPSRRLGRPNSDKNFSIIHSKPRSSLFLDR